MKPKSLVVLMIIILISNLLTSLVYIGECTADVLPKFYVDDDYDSSTPGWQVDHFDSIQDAIDASSAGDRVLVYAGTYSETLTIPHKLDLFGEDRSTTIITGSDTGDRITISAEYINISHFNIKNCGTGAFNATILIDYGHTIITDNIIESGGKHGISINNCNYNIIYDNTIKSNSGNGIRLNQSNYNEITYNSITSNSYNGIFVYTSSNNTIQYNTAIQSNSLNGIFLNETCNDTSITYNNMSSNTKNGLFLNDHCDSNTLSNNNIYGNSDSGIRLENSSSNTMNSNEINLNTDYGIMVVGSSNTIQSNTIYNNKVHGILLFADDNNVISSNTIRSNTYDGIRLSNSTSDSIYSNEISSNSGYGVNSDYFTLDNLIYNNYFHDNTNNAIDKSISKNRWNTTIASGTNKVGGSYIYGNYWDNFDETSEGAIDSNGNGIADSAYTVYGSNQDNGPLLDVTVPSIGTPGVTPITQTIGGYTYISATVTDNIEIRDVVLIVTDPNSLTVNFSIFQNKTGNTFYCNKKYTTVGTYSFIIRATDPRNSASSSSVTFYINEGTAPTVTDNSPTKGYASKVFTFNATVTDDGDSASQLTVKVQWSHGAYSANTTLDSTQGNYFEKSVTLDNTTSSLSYYFWAKDHWGNARTTTTKTVSVIDNEAPAILINAYGPSPEILPNSFTFNATVTDNTEVNEVTIEYWNEGSDHKTANMDKTINNCYEKMIIDENPDRIYCIIYATDPYENQNDTKNPFANASGHYTGVIGGTITFNGSNSFDLDGNITDYSWNFGDGTTGAGATTTHEYTTNGNYTITLTVTDDDGNTDVSTTYAVIISSSQQKTSATTMNQIANAYGVTLTKLFYGYDTDGDRIVDTFVDPNNVLKTVHTGSINISGNRIFLLSVNDSIIPEFMWNSSTDKVIYVTHIIGSPTEPVIDYPNKNAIVGVTINKTIDGWIYLEISSPDIGNYGDITELNSVWKNDTMINSDRQISKDNKFYVLDDPETKYFFNFSFKPPELTNAEFSPAEGELINGDNPTITITYTVGVDVLAAYFLRYDDLGTKVLWEEDIIYDLITTDFKTFTYTPPSNLKNGRYTLAIDVRDENGVIVTDEIYYEYQSYVKEGISLWTVLIILGSIGIAGTAVFLLTKFNYINFESFVYIKNKKIIPFFKPLVIGPLRIDVNDEKVKKAEFYVNGKLKDTLTEAPYIWNWNEPAFMKKSIETKIFDQEGKSSSSGEMTFFVFNSPRFFK